MLSLLAAGVARSYASLGSWARNHGGGQFSNPLTVSTFQPHDHRQVRHLQRCVGQCGLAAPIGVCAMLVLRKLHSPRRHRQHVWHNRCLVALSSSHRSARSGLVEPKPTLITRNLLLQGDDSTSNAIVEAFAQDARFTALAIQETQQILARDSEDAEKLEAGIRLAVDRGVLSPNPPVEPVRRVDVTDKSAMEVAQEIAGHIGDAKDIGCVLVLCGLSGTGKGTTGVKLQTLLPRCVCWSNGNVFRSLTLLAVIHCEQFDIEFASDVLTQDLLQDLMNCLHLEKINGKFDIRIKGYGLDLYVSQVANTILKQSRVSRNIPTVAHVSQGEVVRFAAEAANVMRRDGMTVIMEGREQTLNYVRTPYRFELVFSDQNTIGERRAAQRIMGQAATKVEDQNSIAPEEVMRVLVAELTALTEEVAASSHFAAFGLEA